jgi:chaperone modulatory protein CbpM
MKTKLQQVVTQGQLLDEAGCLTLADLSHACHVHAEWILELVEEGIIDPMGDEISQWRFSGSSLQRARVTRHLQNDLGVNLAVAALVLDMMDEMARLRRRLNRMDFD